MFKPTLTAAIEETIDVPDSDATVTIKYLKPGVMAAITNESMKLTAKQQDSGGMNSEIAFNLSKKNNDIVLACVKGWSGFTDDASNTMKFSQANLLKMIDESEEFVSWVVEQHEKLSNRVESEQEAATKN
jgi:hypothetical protein